MSKATLYSDGGARGNPGPAAIGFVLDIVDGDVIKHGEYVGAKTNNQAEYLALKAGLLWALQAGVDEISCFLDSELVVKQLAGEYRVKDAKLKELFFDVEQLREQFGQIEFKHVPREKNKEADRLLNEALDKNTPRFRSGVF